MSKFCKVFESKGEQLLVLLTPSEEHEDSADILQMFEMDGAVVKITIGGGEWEASERFLENYEEEKALEILEDPQAYVEKLMGL